MLALVRDLEDCQMLDAGIVHIEPSWFSVAELLENTVAAVERLAKQSGVRVEAEPTSLRLCADRNRLLQVAINLTTNALKFSPPGGIVRLSARTADNGIQIMVADQGVGVPASAVASIFDRFSQVRQSDSKVKGGSGLGLAICKSLVELHGGIIRVESEENKGSVFSFIIPNAFDGSALN
jgi:signal transduction histidine kinase